MAKSEHLIEGINCQLRKVTKSKSLFLTDDSLLKMHYLAMIDITQKWTGRRQDWSVIHAQLAVYFADRIELAGTLTRGTAAANMTVKRMV